VPDALWPVAADAAAIKSLKTPLLPPALAARWNAADTSAGEIVSLAVIQAGNGNLHDLPPSVAAAIVKRLTDAGFIEEARAFAREVIAQAML
jgi:hypothetical protein